MNNCIKAFLALAFSFLIGSFQGTALAKDTEPGPEAARKEYFTVITHGTLSREMVEKYGRPIVSPDSVITSYDPWEPGYVSIPGDFFFAAPQPERRLHIKLKGN